MDRYLGIKVLERECLSSTSTATKASMQHTIDEKSNSQESLDSSRYTSFPRLPSHFDKKKQQQSHSRSDSVHDMSDHETDEVSSDEIVEAFARYTDASPPCSESQYDGKTEEEQAYMRRRDYAKELSRIMGRQLVEGLRNDR